MEQALGRSLKRNETIHHKDGNRTNNDLSNLELRNGQHGSGQRPNDLIAAVLSQPELTALDRATQEQIRHAIARVLN